MEPDVFFRLKLVRVARQFRLSVFTDCERAYENVGCPTVVATGGAHTLMSVTPIGRHR